MTSAIDPQLAPHGVCAVVVTYNRKELLRECLASLLAQTHPLRRILVVDNASTDGSSDMLAQRFPASSTPEVVVMRLPANIGGAGGFHEGMKRAAADTLEWLWLMDDDTIPRPDALEQLFAARQRFTPQRRPDLLASRVTWTDGSLHPMNVPWAKHEDAEELFSSVACATLPLRTATFVSLLLHRSVIEEFGLPIKEYFLAGDDVEYTARVLSRRFGVLVPASVVLHKTPTPAGTLDSAPPKFYYYVRNTVWMLTRSEAFRGWRRAKLAVRFVLTVAIYLRRRALKDGSVTAVARGLWHARRHPGAST